MPLDGTNGSGEKSGNAISLKEALDNIEKTLDSMNMDRPLMKSAILSISIRLLNSGEKTTDEIIWELQGEGVDAFMNKYKVERAPNSDNSRSQNSTGKRSAMAMPAIKEVPRRPGSVQMSAVKAGSGELPSVADGEPVVGAKFKVAREAAT
jgi:hypothetical protein